VVGARVLEKKLEFGRWCVPPGGTQLAARRRCESYNAALTR